jgi:hypothetical protein
MSLSNVQLFSIPVTDQDQARAFSVGTLGLELVAGAATSLTLVTWFPTMPAGSLKGAVLETTSPEETIQETAVQP